MRRFRVDMSQGFYYGLVNLVVFSAHETERILLCQLGRTNAMLDSLLSEQSGPELRHNGIKMEGLFFGALFFCALVLFGALLF